MAKAEFYEISIRDKNGNIDKRIDIINELKNIFIPYAGNEFKIIC